MATVRRISWASSERYSPVQDRVGMADPRPGELPPATARVNQRPDPYSPAYLDQREILRVTYQGDDRCQLRCPGCYTGQRLLRPSLPPVTLGGTAEGGETRLRVPFDDFTGHVHGLGRGLQDFYLRGAEPTMDPEGSATKLRWAAELGLSVMSITNGVVSPDRFDHTFGRSLDAGELYKLIVSLDSIDPAVNNELRASPLAYDRTMATIRRCVARNQPLKVQMTVWPRNYPTILETVEALWELGVRGFAFHCGSVEGAPDFLDNGLDHLDPLAWRALCERLYEFRGRHRDELVHFNFPLLYFTEDELRDSVIGDDQMTDRYLQHVSALENGEVSVKPFQACPALDVPQVYVFGNDGGSGRGVVSLCNVHSEDSAAAFAEYDPTQRRWAVVTDPARNQMQTMIDSPHLCPAMRNATGGRISDRVMTEAGELYHACRYLGCNQVPTRFDQFGITAYEHAVEFYQAVQVGREAFAARVDGRSVAVRTAEPYLSRVRRLTTGLLTLRERTIAVLRDTIDAAGQRVESLTGSFDPDLLDAVRATDGRQAAVPILLPIRPVGPAGLDGPAPATCGGCR